MGLAFSVPEGIKVPSSLVNIFKELQQDLGCSIPSHGNLERWAVQGVLLLNTVLTVMFPLYHYQQKHPLNFVFLGLFTVFLSLSVGIACANTKGRIVLEALILTTGVVFALTGYTFWASKKGKDFSYHGPILFAGLMVLFLTGLIQRIA